MKKAGMLTYLFKEYILLIFLMWVCRILFIGFNKSGLKDIPLSVMGKSFFYGWIFDNAVTCYYLGLLLILLLVYWILHLLWMGILGKLIINIYY